MNKPTGHIRPHHHIDATETIELIDTGARLRLNDQVVEERSWWNRLSHRRRGEALVLTGLPPRAGDPHDDVVFPCPQCGQPGHTDIHDKTSGRRYLSCNSCFKMWQESGAPDVVRDVSWLMK